MEAEARRTRGFVTLGLIHALRRGSGGETIASLADGDLQLIADGLEPTAWVEQDQCLRLATAAHEHACAGSWSSFHELSAASVTQLLELGYRAVVRIGDPAATFAALSVLWRASFSYGRALADTDANGATIHVIDCDALGELEGNVHAGWCLGVARLIGAECRGLELRRRPWADEGNEQVVRLHWREQGSTRRPTPASARGALAVVESNRSLI